MLDPLFYFRLTFHSENHYKTFILANSEYPDVMLCEAAYYQFALFVRLEGSM